MEIFIVEQSKQIDVVEGSLEVKEEPEEDPLAGYDIHLLLGLSFLDPGKFQIHVGWN